MKNRLHEVYFKIENENENETHSYYNLNFVKFFEDFGISIETYNFKVLINLNNEYFIKLEVVYQSLHEILEKINSLCIFENCSSEIIQTGIMFCKNHLESDVNPEVIGNYFKNRSDKLEQTFFDYSRQSDLFNYLKTHPRNSDNTFKFDNDNIELLLIPERDDLLEIKLNMDDDNDNTDCIDAGFTVSITDIDEISINDTDDEDDCNINKYFSKIVNIINKIDMNSKDSEGSDDESDNDSD